MSLASARCWSVTVSPGFMRSSPAGAARASRAAVTGWLLTELPDGWQTRPPDPAGASAVTRCRLPAQWAGRSNQLVQSHSCSPVTGCLTAGLRAEPAGCRPRSTRCSLSGTERTWVRAERPGKGNRRAAEGTSRVADHLKADLARIEQVSRSLASLRDEFANLTKIADVGAAAGDPGLASALLDFATDWSDKRTALTGEMHQLSQLAAEPGRAHRDSDVAPAHPLATAGAGPGGRPVTGPGGISR